MGRQLESSGRCQRGVSDFDSQCESIGLCLNRTELPLQHKMVPQGTVM